MDVRQMTQLLPAARAALSQRLAALERRRLAPPTRLEHRPLFVISLPRSGSTLLYQLMLQRFRLAYFSNLMAAFPESPVALAWISRWFGGQSPPRDLRSNFGATRGWRGANQGWRLWNRWLPESQDFIDPASLDAAAVGEMRATVDLIQRGSRAPFASKWQRHAPRLRALATAFPEALFVHLRRSPELTAQSILAGRRRFLGDETQWLSARPRDFERIRHLDPLEQVCAQVVALERDIREDVALIGTERFMFASYESLCLAPQAVLDGMADWYRERAGQALRIRRKLDVSLDLQSRPQVAPDEFERIRDSLERLYAAESLA
jgi:Sulfotransferase family